MSESDLLATRPAPPWLSEFEALATSVVGANTFERENSERLLKKWVASQPDPCQELLSVIQISRSPQSIIVAVLLCRNEALKQWGQSQEGNCA